MVPAHSYRHAAEPAELPRIATAGIGGANRIVIFAGLEGRLLVHRDWVELPARVNGLGRSPSAQAQAKLIDRLGPGLSFILGIYGDLGRQTAEAIANVPAALAAI
jgi:hypothetical protein